MSRNNTEGVNQSYMRYVKDIKNYKTMTKDEEMVLRSRILSGDEKAKTELIERHLKFVIKIAKEMTNDGDDIMENICEGNAGLIHSLDTFDFSRDNRFMTYAIFWIKNFIGKSKKVSEVIKKPVLIENTKITQGFDSVDFNIGEDADVDKDNDESENIKNSSEMKVTNLMLVLSNKEREIINRYYGINGTTEANLTEIGDNLGLTRERVRQIKFSALRKIRMNS